MLIDWILKVREIIKVNSRYQRTCKVNVVANSHALLGKQIYDIFSVQTISFNKRVCDSLFCNHNVLNTLRNGDSYS